MIKTIGTIPAEKLLGMEIDLLNKIRTGAITISQFEKFLQKKNPFGFPQGVELGTYRSIEKLQKAMDESVDTYFNVGREILNSPQFYLEPKVITVRPMILSRRDLDLEYSVSNEQFYSAAFKKSYLLCPPEFPIQLRLQYIDQPKDEKLYIATQPFKSASGKLSLLRVLHGDARILSSVSFDEKEFSRLSKNPESVDDKWVFLKRTS